MNADWESDLALADPFSEGGRGNKTRCRIRPAHVAGLISPGDSKSIHPMAACADEVSHDRLYHFAGAGIWDGAPLEATLWQSTDDLVSGDRYGRLSTILRC